MKKNYSTQLELNLAYINGEITFKETLDIAEKMNKSEEEKKKVDTNYEKDFPYDIGFLMWSPFLWIFRNFKSGNYKKLVVGLSLMIAIVWGAVSSFGSSSGHADPIPQEFVGKRIYLDYYPLCDRWIEINEDRTFVRQVSHSTYNYQGPTKKITGRLNEDGTITFTSDNSWYWQGNIKPITMLPAWGYSTDEGKFIVKDKSYQNRPDGTPFGDAKWHESLVRYAVSSVCETGW